LQGCAGASLAEIAAAGDRRGPGGAPRPLGRARGGAYHGREGCGLGMYKIFVPHADIFLAVADPKGLFTAHESNSTVNSRIVIPASSTRRAPTVLVSLQPIKS